MSAFILWMIFGFITNFAVLDEIYVPDIQIEDAHILDEVKNPKEASAILEIEGSPEEMKKYIEAYYPQVEVAAVYTILFQGIAVKGKPEKIHELEEHPFVEGAYPVQTYEAFEDQTYQMNALDSLPGDYKDHINFPSELNPTVYTGKGVKVAVIDTGIDFNHPDLKKNYKGGYDLVDLDDEPMETTIEEGIPTNHGSHVAGIIAANGNLKGVAPDSDIYAYRALGPGGSGTSIQVIAAMEEAVKRGADVMNLSLGNTINSPDYPTSKAVNKAVEKGIAVVIANGNDGPDRWTAGSPATAPLGLAVGALTPKSYDPVLVDPVGNKVISLTLAKPAAGWNLNRDYQITAEKEKADNKIGMLALNERQVAEQIKEWESKGVKALLIEPSERKTSEWFMEMKELETDLPIAIISQEDYQYIKAHANVYYKNELKPNEVQIAAFSSRGPVAMNWMIKPDVSAPGVNIISTVPGGYDVLNGTSMAAPHVAGAIAVIKEAKPDWTASQIIAALKTTAKKIDGAEPNEQGAGSIQIEEAIQTDIIINNTELSFGRLDKHLNERTLWIEIENVSDKAQTFRFKVPMKEQAVTWNLPMPFTVQPREVAKLPVTLTLNSMQLEEKLIQGWLSMEGEDRTYELPYSAVNVNADFPRVMGFEFYKKNKEFFYSFYAAEKLKKLTVKLYDPVTLAYEGELWEWKEIKTGENSGVIAERKIAFNGIYYGLIFAETESGEIITDHTDIIIPE